MTDDTVHVVVSEDGAPIAVTPDHETAINALTAAGGDAVLWEDIDLIGPDGEKPDLSEFGSNETVIV
jgi:hypothetical protein